MLDLARPLRRLIRDPRLRIVVALFLILLAFALAWHLVGMGEHFMMMGTCLAVIVVIGMAASDHEALVVRSLVILGSLRFSPIPDRPAPMTGRPPPQQGTVLRP